MHLDNPNSHVKPAPCTFENPVLPLEPINDGQQTNNVQTSMSFITQKTELRNISQMLPEVKASTEWPEWEKFIETEVNILREMGN